MLKKLKSELGFTLLEMLIVLFVIGALIMIIMPNLTNAGVQAQQKSCDANKKIILAQAEAYFLENSQTYPKDVAELVTAKYLREAPICPVKPDEKESYIIETTEVNVGGSKEVILVVKCEFHDQEP